MQDAAGFRAPGSPEAGLGQCPTVSWRHIGILANITIPDVGDQTKEQLNLKHLKYGSLGFAGAK